MYLDINHWIIVGQVVLVVVDGLLWLGGEAV